MTNEEDDKRLELANKWTKEIFQKFGIENFTNYDNREITDNEFYFYECVDSFGRICLFADIGFAFGVLNLSFPISTVTNRIMQFFEMMFSDEYNKSVLRPAILNTLKIKNIDIFTLLNTDKTKVEQEIETRTKEVLELFIQNIHFFAHTVVIDGMTNSLHGYFQHDVKKKMKEHWEKLGLPKNFSIATQSDLDKMEYHNTNKKRWFTGDKKLFLGKDMLDLLPKRTDELREEYKKAKSRYKLFKKEFASQNRHFSAKKWTEKWDELKTQHFFHLNKYVLTFIEEKPPFEMALMHLSADYNYKPETLRKILSQCRKAQNKK